MIHELQPGILINNRTGLPADFDTPENQIILPERHWESCQVVHGSWFYNPALDVMDTWSILLRLIHCAMDGGNILLDVGHKPDGAFPDSYVERLREVGRRRPKNRAACCRTLRGLLSCERRKIY